MTYLIIVGAPKEFYLNVIQGKAADQLCHLLSRIFDLLMFKDVIPDSLYDDIEDILSLPQTDPIRRFDGHFL